MIKRFEINNFKGLKEGDLSFGKLNLLAGLNGMGKSSLIQALLLLRHSDRIAEGVLNLNPEEFISLGRGKDVFYQYGEEKHISFIIENREGTRLKWDFDYAPQNDYLKSEQRYDRHEIKNSFNLFSENFQYLQTERFGPRAFYPSSSLHVNTLKQIGSKGEFAAHYIDEYGIEDIIHPDVLHHPSARSRSLTHELNAWLGEISPGTKLNTTAVSGTEMILLDIQFETKNDYTNRFRPSNVGFGISFVLPVVLALLMAKEDRLIIIENPEAHLHPRGQAELGKLMARAAATGAQLIIETHSDHILNSVRVSVKNGEINKDDVKIFFFDRKNTREEQYSFITPVQIDRNGELSEYPENFLQEWNNQLFRLL
ncbi:MAG TPA: DUF3696 domain-containing protein [Bacteroidetes bacterium]|nr:DUF3696 domain-containing protein [Bacteroidota bacterium]